MATVQPHARVRPGTRHASHVERYAAVFAYVAALALVVVLSAPAFLSRGPSSAEQAAAVAVPARPADLPAFIPSWAWKISAWHDTKGSERGRRPRGAPHPLPRWYWTWHAWRVQIRHASGSEAART